MSREIGCGLIRNLVGGIVDFAGEREKLLTIEGYQPAPSE